MGLLKEAVIEQSAAKIAIMGFQGSGKTLTALLIALGLSKTYHQGAPIAMHDPEGTSDFLVPIARAEGVKLFVRKSTSFTDMVAVLKEAEQAGCCVFIEDGVSRTWAELQTSLMRKKNINRLQFEHWNQLKETWRSSFVDKFLASPLHCIINGRAGFEYETVEDEDGKRSQERSGGTKLKAESEFGFEPHLVIEMEGRRLQNKEPDGPRKRRLRKHGGQIVHYAHVSKDRGRILNGKTFEFADINDYKAGDFKKVFDTFTPHWATLNVGQQHVALDTTANSGDLFSASGSSQYAERAKRKDIAVEELKGMLIAVWPGQDAVSKDGKAKAINILFDVFSWKAAEEKSVDELERAVVVMRKFVDAMQNGDVSAAEVERAVAILVICRDAVLAETPNPKIGEVAAETVQGF